MTRRPHKWDPICPPPRGLVRPVRIDRTGRSGPTPNQARGPRWRQASWGFHVPADVDQKLPEQRIMEASVRLPPSGAVTGWAGLRLWRGNFFDGLLADGRTPIPVPLCTGGPSLRAAAEITSLSRLAAYLPSRAGWAGLPQVYAALELASERSLSPNETRLRDIYVRDAGLPTPLVNQPVFDLRGRLLGIADLLDLAAGLAGESDGADHREASRHSKDVLKEDRFRRNGIEVFRVTGPDMVSPPRIVGRIHAARRRALWQSMPERTWTTDPPPWRVSGPSLDEILDRREVMRDLYEEQLRTADPDIRDIRGW